MTVTTPRAPLVLAVHPTNAGFGWAALEGPLAVHDWGVSRARIDKNANSLRRLEQILDRLLPETLVLEAFECRQTVARQRITKLCRAIVDLANGRGMEIAIYTRPMIRSTFESVGAVSRQEVAEAIGRQIPMLAGHVPQRRRAWEGEPHRLQMFSAVAVALTHYRLSCDELLRNLE